MEERRGRVLAKVPLFSTLKRVLLGAVWVHPPNPFPPPPPFPPAEILNTYETFMLISFLFSSSFVFPIYFSLQEDSDRNNKYTRVCLSCLCGFVIKTQSRKRRRVGILFDFIPDVNFRERSSVESGDCININNKPLPGTIHIYTPSREFV